MRVWGETNLEPGDVGPAEQQEKPRVYRHAEATGDRPDGHRPEREIVDAEKGAPLLEPYDGGVDCSKADKLEVRWVSHRPP